MEFTNLKKKDILILGKSTTDGLDDATITAGTEYSINFTEQDKKIWLFESILQWKQFFFNRVKIGQFKVKSFEIHESPLCLGNISKGFSVDNMKKLGLYGYVYGFSVDYDSTDVDDILNIHIYLMKRK